MDQTEVVLRVIGILTESQRMYAAVNEDVEADYQTSGAIGELFNEVFPSVAIPVGATPQEAGEAVAHAAVATTIKLTGAFAFLFSELAAVHDDGRSDIKSEDLLRELALRFFNPPADA
ncbi:hypothetical protein [Streptomyces gibsoniae]|uniref:Uncharacterized protein n=1 Tax=Streptomyces gibsoniae TaxID=3075529 RepID=A0ABU2U1G7_9ACTN|nr:hypothetical protein [Streptomyces sp. DSM 41699]MDT0467054.1 hypothetical protein [Streptomyces sp. DSM 41699]